MAIAIPDRFYDYVLYYECGSKEKSTPSLWTNIRSTSAGALLKGVNWSASGYDVGDNAGITRFGVTGAAITSYKSWSKNSNYKLNSANAWVQMVNYFWKTACADQAANVACAVIMCQGKWGGWSNSCISTTCDQLRKNADKEGASSVTGSGYSVIAKLTHYFSNPMDAFIILRNCRIAYLRSLKSKSQFFNGWMRREFFAMQGDGLYCEPGSSLFTKYGTTPISSMETVAAQLKNNSSSGYVKLMSWDGTPSSNISLDGIDDGGNDPSVWGDSSSNSGAGDNLSHGNIIDGGTYSQGLNSANSQKGMVLGMTINQK